MSPASLDGKHAEFKRVMLDKVTHDEPLLKALVNHARLVDRYNTVYREKFGKELARILQLPDVREVFVGVGAEPVSSTPDQMDDMLKSYVANVRKLAGEMRITLE